ncbi:hypothetical protein BD309DRAFT_130614 [Dichomitus squalens]|nr:hypothetical protein BD309DRAFT_130614 [Dichomitus squalens]
MSPCIAACLLGRFPQHIDAHTCHASTDSISGSFFSEALCTLLDHHQQCGRARPLVGPTARYLRRCNTCSGPTLLTYAGVLNHGLISCYHLVARFGFLSSYVTPPGNISRFP